jgi:hypothetical protein
MPTSRTLLTGPVHLTDAQTNAQYVLVPADAYQAVSSLFEQQELPTAAACALVEPVVAAAGWLDPSMDAYDYYDRVPTHP